MKAFLSASFLSVPATAVLSAIPPSLTDGTCANLLVDDFASQSRLTFLFYNAMLQPSSDDGTMAPITGRADTATSVIISNNHLTLTSARDGTSYWYTMLGCTRATDIRFQGLDTDHLLSLLLSGISKPITLGPIAFYCGVSATAYPVPSTVPVLEPTSKIAEITGPSAFVIDTFGNVNSNNLGFYHGGDDATTYKLSKGRMIIDMKGNSDLSWYTQVSDSCSDFTANNDGYLHIAYSGSNAFTIAMQQHNPTCDPNKNPWPYTWDSVEALRYSNTNKTDLYVPISHFEIDYTKTIGFVLKGFYTSIPTLISKIEIVQTVPNGFLVPSKLSTAPLIFACTRPNSFAFAIDDEAGIHVTFFTVGAPLLDQSTNLTNVYKSMLAAGHQIAYHSYTHPPMDGLPSLAAIDWELNNDISAVSQTLGITSKYFRPPFGTEGARIRQRLAASIPGAKFVEWSVDVQDWLWAESSTPENQIKNFQSDVDKGGNLVVMHYLYNTTVSYLPQFINIAKKTGKQLMRVDQCMEDPDAPPL
ncbi:Peptidoglycan-N-acetylglucosamine deacetylase [Lachnellula subtilissima]|uniref:Peptidoglycan-N-acetylglucosamine deacetylase n=1 Tax=Lachnellula subtilissima TaxID=602034 RepID=A0A8H8UF00_9HELO|nr:Peptidoglycan-N-acetylglucosamine deacetylase [Lachnellula subtilissima]